MNVDQALIKKLRAVALQIRIDSLRATTAAGTGHPTSCLSASDMIAAIFCHALNYDYADPFNNKNDRFIISKGHAVPVIYAALHQMGVISEADLLSYRNIDSVFEGHPTPRFVHNQASTGSLGQGLSIGLGMALNARYAKRDYTTYVMLGDSEIAEGSVWEAAELASQKSVDSLIAIVDVNRLGQSGEAIGAHHVDRIAKKFEAFGWHVINIDGHDIQSILEAITEAKNTRGRPSAIIAKTFKGYGLDGIEDKIGFHGKPFSKDELVGLVEGLKKRYADVANESIAAEFRRTGCTHAPSKIVHLPVSIPLVQDSHNASFALGKKMAPRKAFGLALAALARNDDRVFALDAEVKNSTYTEFFEKEYPERFVQSFVAEQNMIGIATGLVLRGRIPFAATFGSFFSRAYDQIRMAGVGRAALRLVGTHCGVSIGQDGPSQMALEDISMMRAVPESVIVWPSDGVSAYKLVETMANYHDGVSYMKATRGDLPVLYDANEEFPLGGCKVLRQSQTDVLSVVASGITVHEALKAHDILKAEGISVAVIDLYSIKPLDSKALADVIKKSGNKALTVEDHYRQGGMGETVICALEGTGIRVTVLAVDQLPRSGSPEALMALMGIDAAGIVRGVKALCA